MARLHDVPVAPLPIERFREVLDDDALPALLDLAEHAGRAPARARRVVRQLHRPRRRRRRDAALAAGLHARRGRRHAAGSCSRATPEFFALTKRLHNRLHGAPGDGGPLGDAERDVYERGDGARGAASCVELVRPGDVVILHDPQTAGLAPALRERGRDVVWRCHVGVDAPNGAGARRLGRSCARTSRRPTPTSSRARRTSGTGSTAIASASSRRRSMSSRPRTRRSTRRPRRRSWRPPGSLAGRPPRAPAVFVRHDGTPGRVDRAAEVVAGRAAAARRAGRRAGLALGPAEGPARRACTDSPRTPTRVADAHLVLAGPATSAVADDPEGAEVLEEVVAAWQALPDGVRARVHLAALPMDDARGERGDRQRAAAPRHRRRAEVDRRGLRADRRRGDVEGPAGRRQPRSAASRIRSWTAPAGSSWTRSTSTPTAARSAGCWATRACAQRLGAAARERVREAYLGPRHLAPVVRGRRADRPPRLSRRNRGNCVGDYRRQRDGLAVASKHGRAHAPRGRDRGRRSRPLPSSCWRWHALAGRRVRMTLVAPNDTLDIRALHALASVTGEAPPHAVAAAR